MIENAYTPRPKLALHMQGPGSLDPPRDFVFGVRFRIRDVLNQIARARGDADPLRFFTYSKQQSFVDPGLSYAPYEAPAVLLVGYEGLKPLPGAQEGAMDGLKRKRADAGSYITPI